MTEKEFEDLVKEARSKEYEHSTLKNYEKNNKSKMN
jgi:hypothetical protein